MLTKKQKRVLDIITNFIKVHKYPPTVRELGQLLGLRSSATVTSYLVRLEIKGYISRIDNTARGIKVLKGA